MVLVGIGMLVVGVLLGGFLIYLWTRPKPAPLPEPAPTVPLDVERVRALQRRDEDEVFDRMGEVFNRMDDIFDRWLGERPTNRRQRTGGGLFQTRTTTVTRTPAPSSATPPSVPAQAQPSVTLFDHLSKEDDDLL